MRTWHYEALVVAGVLAGTTLAAGGRGVDWLGSAAVLTGFLHAQIGFRLAEAEAERARFIAGTADEARLKVECYAKMDRYFVQKECLWGLYFVLTQAWPALVGVAVFAVYPLWRGYWVERRRQRVG